MMGCINVFRSAFRAASLAALIVTLASAPPSALAATLHIVDLQTRHDPSPLYFEPTCNMKLVGEIQAGDAERMKAVKQAFNADPSRYRPPREAANHLSSDPEAGYLALCLSSQGGDIREALAISELFIGWMTVVEDGDECYSACAVLFMQAVSRSAIDRDRAAAGRHLHVGGKLGFHAPSLVVPTGSALNAADVSDAYERALATIEALLFRPVREGDGSRDGRPVEWQPGNRDTIWIVDRETRSMRLPITLFFAMLTVPPGEMFVISTVNEALSWRIDLYGYVRPRFISERMMHVACVNVADLQCGNPANTRGCLDGRRAFLTRYFKPFGELFFERTPLRGTLKTAAISRLASGRPLPGGLSVTTARMLARLPEPDQDRPAPADRPCDLRIVEQGGTLIRLDLEVFNGLPVDRAGHGSLKGLPDELLATFAHRLKGADPRTPRAGTGAETEPATFPVWAMLPVLTTFDEMRRGPWALLEAGGPMAR